MAHTLQLTRASELKTLAALLAKKLGADENEVKKWRDDPDTGRKETP